MPSFNRIIIAGNLTRDVELKHIESGTAVADVHVAINDRRKSQDGEWLSETTFVPVTLWGKVAETASEYLSKGSAVLIEGRLRRDVWEQDGERRSRFHVVAERMQMLGGPKQSQGAEEDEPVTSTTTPDQT